MAVAVLAQTPTPAYVSGIIGAPVQSRKACSKFLVQNSIRHAFTRRSRKLKLRDLMRMDTEIGPIATRPQFEKVLHYIDPATSEGAMCSQETATGEGLGGGRFDGHSVVD
jgi:aldehyde dehydrogenase (NAD+)